MKRLVCLLLACLLLCGAALAENMLPVLVAQLGTGAEMVASEENGDEYQQTLSTDAAQVTMGRYAGELTAEDMALRVVSDIREGEMLVDGEGGIDQRAVFLTGENEDTTVVDTSVIWLDGFTYGFVCLVNSDLYYGYTDADPFSETVDFWVNSLDVFDGAVAEEENSEATIMLLYGGELYESAEMSDAGFVGEDGSYMQLIADDGRVVIGEYTLSVLTNTADMEAALLSAVQQIHADAADFFYEASEAMTAQLGGYPAYLCSWTTGADADMQQVSALVVAGGQTLVLWVGVDDEYFVDYEAQIEDLFASTEIYATGEQMDMASIQAEEIGYSLFGEYAEFVYVWDETIAGEDYCVYEFTDENEISIGRIAVQPETGAAYVSFGEDAQSAGFEPVLWDNSLGYTLADSVG